MFLQENMWVMCCRRFIPVTKRKSLCMYAEAHVYGPACVLVPFLTDRLDRSIGEAPKPLVSRALVPCVLFTQLFITGTWFHSLRLHSPRARWTTAMPEFTTPDHARLQPAN